jgi:large subunit ribosomal protein L23
MALFGKKKKEEDRPEPEKTARDNAPVNGQESAPAPAVKLPKGEDAQSYQVILKPLITEKGSFMEESGKYLFKVAKGANKMRIKSAIEKLYKVKVRGVNVLSMPSKFRQVGKYKGEKSGFKKAIVTLKEGEKIETAK